jgi:PAS domain S-box-containing protein
MSSSSPSKLSAARIALGYALVASLWIALSDLLVRRSAFPQVLHTVKGLAFVWLTAFLLYLTVKRLVEAVRSTSRDRDETAKLYRTLIETSGEGVCLLDKDGRISFCNERLAAMLEYPAQELQGRPFRDLLPEQERARLDQTLREPSREISDTYDCRLQTRSGENVFALISATPMFSGEGDYRGSLAMILDISDRKRLEDELRHSQKLDALGRFAGGIAHDFNNLLGIAIGYGSLLQKQLPPDNSSGHAVGEILVACERGSLLVRQLLAFSRKQSAAAELVDVSDGIRHFGQILPRIVGEDITVEILCENSEGVIRIGAGQIEQILMNLAANARDAMPAGGKLTIATKTVVLDDGVAGVQGVPPGNFIAIQVSDTGAGMTPEVKSHIFEPFFTTKPQGAGTGLGLSTVYGIVRQNGGSIACDSQEDAGTIFTIYLPLISALAQPMERANEAPRVLAGSETVLMVEDEPALRELLKIVLSSHGYEVLEAANGAEAIQIVASFAKPIDLLLTDVVMPEMSGLVLADQALRARPGMRIAFMSGYTELPGELSREAYLIEKPVTPNTLLMHLRKIFDEPANGLREVS